MAEGPPQGSGHGGCAAPAPRTDLTSSVYRGYVRREEDFPEESPEYQAGCEIHNRKRPPPPEVAGDAFDRQRVMCDFDQGLIERQVCLVLGAGGIGMDVALTLARLGVGRIILVDRDVYDATNLTRQCLGGKADVGQRKVDVAAKTLREHHSIRSEVETLHCDVVDEWPRVVEAARRSTAVFNGIDIGVMWDYAVNSLCKELELPLACGQSFAWKFMAEFYTGAPGQCCAYCHDSVLSSFVASESQLRMKGGVLDRFRAFQEQRGPGTDSDAEALAAFLEADRQYRCDARPVLPAALERASLTAVRCGEHTAADLLKFLRGLHDEVTERLMPGKLLDLQHLRFVPRPSHADTRFIGSWVCPCLGCSVLMVSQWAAWLTSPPNDDDPSQSRNPPQTITFNLDTGLTAEEMLGYELGALGMPPDKSERRFSREGACAQCRVCAATQLLRAEETLFAGSLPVHLAQVPGEAVPAGSWQLPTDRKTAAALARSRSEPLSSLGPEYATVVVPAMPALDWERGEASASTRPWPEELATLPLLKVPANSELAQMPSTLRGVASGVRSALVRVRGTWWRLKGCGNRDQGFPVEAKGDNGELNVRGCCFRHNADTELAMSELANAALERAGLVGCNRPVGSFLYQRNEAWPLPAIPRHCAVFETLGNARLGDHLIAGLLRLLPLLVQPSSALRRAIQLGRGADEAEEPWPTSMVVSCGMATADLVQEGLLEARAPPAAAEAGLGDALPRGLVAVWDAAVLRLTESLPRANATLGTSLLLWLAWRLGWEAGSTLKALHDAEICWGTYKDAMGIHCNAHVNNLAVKPPSAPGETFLAALDFDMAFTRESYLPELGHVEDGSWEALLRFEATMGMKMVLAGDDFANTGVENTVKVPESHALVEMAIRDTLVAGYEASRLGAADAHPFVAAVRPAAYDLIRLALCVTTHVEG